MADYKHQVIGRCKAYDCTAECHFAREVQTDDVTTITS